MDLKKFENNDQNFWISIISSLLKKSISSMNTLQHLKVYTGSSIILNVLAMSFQITTSDYNVISNTIEFTALQLKTCLKPWPTPGFELRERQENF